MRRNQKPYSVFQLASAVFMILALLWLTISAPFVFASQQEIAKFNKTAGSNTPLNNTCEEEVANPFGNTTEEKTSNSSSFSEEYLHDHHLEEYFFHVAAQFHKCENADTYIAYHGELDVPPPDVA